MREKIKLVLYYIKNKLFPVGDQINSTDFPAKIAELLGVTPALAMSVVGYLLDLKYIDLDSEKGFILNEKDPQKLAEINILLKDMTPTKAEEMKLSVLV